MRLKFNIKSGFKNIEYKVKRFLVEITTSKVSTHNLALGFAIGTFIAILPTPGFGVLISIFLIYSFKKINATSILFPFAVWNPLVLAPLYILSYKIGDLLFAAKATIESDYTFFYKFIYFCQTYLVGNVIVAVLFSIISYFVIFRVTELFKQKKQLKRIRLSKIRK
ncbi:MAG: DUF2062 domain-containing protein [Bacteroidota bacterium]|jgi:uncharacterized protein (DUF2062 family)|nr:DUF2062 domain-containing protein [Bacteroidota bacterium]